MATLQIFHEWKLHLCAAVNSSSDSFKLYLSNDAPIIATDTIKSDVTGITVANGYTETTLTTTWVETGAGIGTWSLRHNADITYTASGGSFGPFQYVTIYDDTVASPVVDPLLGWWDVGAATTITVGNSFLIDLDAQFAIYDLS